TLGDITAILPDFEQDAVHPYRVVYRIQLAVLPELDLFDGPGGHIGERLYAYLYSIEFFDMLTDIRGGHTPAIHADDGLFQLIAHPLTFGDQLGSKLALAVPRDVQYQVAQTL